MSDTSAIYLGRLVHRRLGPKPHAFAYRLYMLYLDLDELAALPPSRWFGVERARPLSFRRRDYLGDPARPLKGEVLDEVERTLGFRPAGPVRLLTHVRSLGYVFNPVSFYYCFDASGREVQAVVSEITNTPWGERYRHVVRGRPTRIEDRFIKAFHVSPFLPMGQTYAWQFSAPGEQLRVKMRNESEGRVVFRAQLALVRHPFNAAALRRVAIGLPLMSLRMHAAIYLQAARLWLKGAPFHPHPRPSPELSGELSGRPAGELSGQTGHEPVA
jgi:uncharacterized protein